MAIGESDFKNAQAHAEQLKGMYSNRATMLKGIEDIYLLQNAELPAEDWIKETISPDGRIKVDGARRLLTATNPKWSVPKEFNTGEVGDLSDSLERAAATTWRRAGKLQNRPRHYDPALSGVLYGEVQIALQSTKGLAALSKGGAQKRAERAAKQIPCLYETINPKYGYPSWDQLGLNAYASERQMFVSAIRGMYGEGAGLGKKLTDLVTVWDYWSLDYHCVWIAGESTYLVGESNENGYIPVVAVTCEGSALFTDQGQNQTQPLLYTVWKSNLWKRQNLYMTIAASLVFEIGANPLLVFKSDAESFPVVDYSRPGGMIKIGTKEDVYPLLQKILDPTMQQQAGEIDRRFEASTIYSQTLGEPLGANAPFSMVHLLSQSGRLPLVVYQRMISFALGQAMTQTFQMAKEDGFNLMASSKTGLSELKAEDIPDDFDLQCDMDIDMPQDERLNLQIAAEGVKMGLFSVELARRKYINIEQSSSEDDQIAVEKFANQQVEIELQAAAQAEMQKAQAAAAAQAQAAQGGQNPEQGPPSPEQQGNLPPELMAMMQQQGGMDQGGMQQGAGNGMPGLPMMEGAQPMGEPTGPGGMPPEGM